MSEHRAETFLRELRMSDAEKMLEWMHDKEINRYFIKKMMNMDISDVEGFIRRASEGQGTDVHWAITDSTDEYLGTISLKKIDRENGNAEYAIVLRRCAEGIGHGYRATKEVLKKAFDELGLHRVYLTVLGDNEQAMQMYERCGFVNEGYLREHLMIDDRYVDWKLYGILEQEYRENNR